MERSAVVIVVGRGERYTRSDYEQSEPTESWPTAARRPGQTGPTARRRRLAKAGPAAATARSGRTAGRAAEARPTERSALSFFEDCPRRKLGVFLSASGPQLKSPAKESGFLLLQ